MPTFLYYVSGHGFGHARRTAEILRAVATLRPDLRVTVRTTAPPAIFAGLPTVTVDPPTIPLDPGVVERDTLTVDGPASLRKLDDFFQTYDAAVAAESAYLRAARPALVAADISFLPGDAAHRAGVRCVGVGNFTWDWIYQSFTQNKPGHSDGSASAPSAAPDPSALIQRVAAAYRKMECLLQLPLSHPVDSFRRVIPMPLVAGQPRVTRDDVLARLNVNDPRPRVLVAMRGGVSDLALLTASSESPHLLFLCTQRLPNSPDNLRPIPIAPPLDFTDVLAASDVVLSKVGYGILADCVATRTAIAYPPRTGFAEDDISLQVCPQYLRMAEIAPADFAAGHWRPALDAALARPRPTDTMDTTGAAQVAQWLASRT